MIKKNSVIYVAGGAGRIGSQVVNEIVNSGGIAIIADNNKKKINLIKKYPLIQINSALKQLIEDKNEFISDKYGRLGNLINIGDLYLFQPLELNNKNVSLYDLSLIHI